MTRVLPSAVVPLLVLLAGVLAVLGGLVGGPVGAVVGGLPPAIIGAWLAWRDRKELDALKERTRPLTPHEQRVQDDDRRRRDASARIMEGGDRLL